MDQRSSYTADEWQFLQFTPLVVFYSVAYADGSISNPEANSFRIRISQMKQLAVPGTELVREVFESVDREWSSLLARFDSALGSGLTFDAVLQATKKVLSTKCSPGEAEVFREAMRTLATIIAEASPLIGRKVTDKERAAVATVVMALG